MNMRQNVLRVYQYLFYLIKIWKKKVCYGSYLQIMNRLYKYGKKIIRTINVTPTKLILEKFSAK